MNEYTLITYPNPDGEIPKRQVLYNFDGIKIREEVGEIPVSDILKLLNSGAKLRARLVRETEKTENGKAPDRIS